MASQPRTHSQNSSNPFAGHNTANNQASHQSQLYLNNQQQHHNPHALPSHGIGVHHPAFGGVGIFGPQAGNGSLLGSFGDGGALAGGGTGLASHAAQTGFAYGAQLERTERNAVNAGAFQPHIMNGRIREVWANNMDQEMDMIAELVRYFPYVSIDTEFPGIVARPMGEFPTKASYHYQTLRANVDLLKILQLGLTLFSVNGREVPPTQLSELPRNYYPPNVTVCPCTWSFNFRFDHENDMYNEESINVLKKAGFDFEKLIDVGIDPLKFGARLVTSGLTYNEDVRWISFHSGYDFGYLTKIIWNRELPVTEEEYRILINHYFPDLWDVKYLLKYAQTLKKRGILSSQGTTILERLGTRSGLQDLADELGCVRIGTMHQSGSDAWLTGMVFWQFREKIFDNVLPDNLNGQMWGLSGSSKYPNVGLLGGGAEEAGKNY